MATVLQEYRNIIRNYRPGAVCKRFVSDGVVEFQIWDGSEPIGDRQCDTMIAWREAERVLIDEQRG